LAVQDQGGAVAAHGGATIDAYRRRIGGRSRRNLSDDSRRYGGLIAAYKEAQHGAIRLAAVERFSAISADCPGLIEIEEIAAGS
jgi:hypothetical protein